jgi:hypothetical protein
MCLLYHYQFTEFRIEFVTLLLQCPSALLREQCAPQRHLRRENLSRAALSYSPETMTSAENSPPSKEHVTRM